MNILIILAHPDDPEFFMGGTISMWSKLGHKVSYLLLTKGERGLSEEFSDGDALKEVRQIEQRNAAKLLGVSEVDFLDYPDGFLEVNLENRRNLVAEIRKRQPDIVVSSDPQTYFHTHYINHPDHRLAGLLTMEAVFPAAGNRGFYPEQLEQGLAPTKIRELWMSLTVDPNITLDVSDYWQIRIEALKKHVSQIGDPGVFEQVWNQRRQEATASDSLYYEHFRRVILRV
ncbi:MAG: PIG-L family deacetylase [Anaerolineaceae bacterium]|nr:PIG-L family deacetylase [Anaerolineaceae bacterium]